MHETKAIYDVSDFHGRPADLLCPTPVSHVRGYNKEQIVQES